MSEPFLGEIRMFGGNFAPSGWALCNGQLLAISANSALFAILGTTYGGNGVNTFGLPNLQGSLAMHWGMSRTGTQYVIGEVGGNPTTSILTSNMPQHAHTIAPPVSTATGALAPSASNFPAAAAGTISVRGETISVLPYASASTAGQTMANYQSGLVGGNIPLSTMSPYQCVTFIIALQGIFPSRN